MNTHKSTIMCGLGTIGRFMYQKYRYNTYDELAANFVPLPDFTPAMPSAPEGVIVRTAPRGSDGAAW